MRRVYWLIVTVLMLQAFGCARLIPTRAPARSLEELIGPMRERAKPVDTLLAEANVVGSKRGLPGRRHFQARILADPPDRLRLRAFRNANLVFQLLADSWGIRLVDELNKQYYAGDWRRLAEAETVWAGLAPRLVLRGILVEQAVLEALASAHQAEVRRHWRTLELRIRNEEGRLSVYFDRAGDRIVSMTWEPATGERKTRIELGAFQQLEGMRLPDEFVIAHGPSRTRLHIDKIRYHLNVPLRSEVFLLEAPGGKWLPLEVLE